MGSLFRTVLKAAGVLAGLWLALAAYIHTKPVVVIHYSAAATQPVSCFYNGNNYIRREYIYPGDSRTFRTSHDPGPDYFVDVSLPMDGDHVELSPPFSRVDVYLGADRKITRTVTRMDFLARFGFD